MEIRLNKVKCILEMKFRWTFKRKGAEYSFIQKNKWGITLRKK